MQICKFDDVYDYICWRLKLEGETENTGVLFFDDDVNLLAHFFLRGLKRKEKHSKRKPSLPQARRAPRRLPGEKTAKEICKFDDVDDVSARSS